MGIIEGGICVLAGIIIGRLWKRDRHPGVRDPKPVCGCRHHYALHDPETGACHGLVNGNPLNYDSFKSPTAWEQVQCGCQHYVGPEPLPTYVAPEISG